MYEKILLPTDGSAESDRALAHASAIAERFDAELHTVHVVQTPEVADELEDMESIVERLERAGEEAVEGVTERAREQGHDSVESAVLKGDPAGEIASYVDENGIDVIVMSTEARTGPAREMIGSVTEAVVRKAPAPVLTVNAD